MSELKKNQILQVINSYCSGKFNRKIALSGGGDDLEEISESINRLGDFLSNKPKQDEQIKQEEEPLKFDADLMLKSLNHELQSPLDSIIQHSENILQKDLRKDQFVDASIIRDTTHQLKHILHDFLVYSRLEYGNLEIHSRKNDLREFLSSVERIFMVIARKKNLQLVVNVDPNVPKYFNFDETKLRQVMLNLVSNAIKFTEKGNVKISASCRTLDTTHSLVTITVEDSGRGIPKNKVKDLFSISSQAKAETYNLAMSSLLGLSISQKIVNVLGSEIKVATKLNHGSKFYMEFIWQHNGDGPTDYPISNTDEIKKRLEGAKVLLVDDNKVNRDIGKFTLEQLSCSVDLVCSGEDCIKALQQDTYSILFLDIHMPGMDGFETVQKISETIEDQRRPQIYFLSGDAQISNQEKAKNLGVKGVIPKPISKGVIINALTTEQITPSE